MVKMAGLQCLVIFSFFLIVKICIYIFGYVRDSCYLTWVFWFRWILQLLSFGHSVFWIGMKIAQNMKIHGCPKSKWKITPNVTYCACLEFQQNELKPSDINANAYWEHFKLLIYSKNRDSMLISNRKPLQILNLNQTDKQNI